MTELQAENISGYEAYMLETIEKFEGQYIVLCVDSIGFSIMQLRNDQALLE